MASLYQACVEKKKKKKIRPKCYFLLWTCHYEMNAVRSNVSFPHSFIFPTIDGQRLSRSAHNSSLFLCESQVKVPTRCSSQTSPRCFCLSLCWSSVWGAFPDTICLCNGFQWTVFWSDPPVRPPPPTGPTLVTALRGPPQTAQREGGN